MDSLQHGSLASWRRLGQEIKWPTLFSPSETTTELPWSKALNPLLVLLCSKNQCKTDCSAAPQCECCCIVNEDVGQWKTHHTQAVKTFPQQINIKYDINTIPLWNHSLAAPVCVRVCVCVCVSVYLQGEENSKKCRL